MKMNRSRIDLKKVVNSGTLIKDDKSTRITYIHKPFFYEPVILKQFKFKGWLHCLLRSLKVSRARNYTCSARLITKLGITTPKVITFNEKKKGCFIIESYVVTEFYKGLNARHLIEQPHFYTKDQINHFVSRVVSILTTLFNNNITHGDTKVPNFMISDSGICLIDLDVVKINKSKRSLKKNISKDIKRFERDWINHPHEKIVTKNMLTLRDKFL